MELAPVSFLSTLGRPIYMVQAEALEPQGQLPPLPFAYRGNFALFFIAIELFYHPNNFASNVRNVINESNDNRCWSSLVILNCRLPGYYILFVDIISYFHYNLGTSLFCSYNSN